MGVRLGTEEYAFPPGHPLLPYVVTVITFLLIMDNTREQCVAYASENMRENF
jgi:hypothetical protein